MPKVTFDTIGNPLTYDGYTYTWEIGRQLKSINKTGQSISFRYNDSGIRTEKTVNGVKTTYHLVGDKVTFESNGTDNVYYTYDSAGKLVSMNLNGTEYFYVRNAQGDIIGLIDKAGTQVVYYTYDSWGKLISIKDATGADITNNTTHIGYKNPYRYRGYRYDTETGLYYLQSRYYNPEWGRFINADALGGSVGELLSHNVFAYCKNNPISRKDPSGFRSFPITGEDPDEYTFYTRHGDKFYDKEYANPGTYDGRVVYSQKYSEPKKFKTAFATYEATSVEVRKVTIKSPKDEVVMHQMVAFYKGETSNKIPGSDEYAVLAFFVGGAAKFGSRKAGKVVKYASTGVLAEVAFWGSGAYGGLKYMSEHSGLAGEEIILIQH